MTDTRQDALKIAVVGAGYFSQFHYDAWRRLPGADLVALADSNAEAARATAARFAVPQVFESLDALKARIREDIQGQADSASRSRLVQNIVEELIRLNEFDVPESMVQNYIENLIESFKREQPGRPIDEAAFRTEALPGAERGVKRYLLLEAIAKHEKIEVTKEDLDAHLEGAVVEMTEER